MNESKILLIINGSPRRRGNISCMLDIMRQEAESCGWSTETVRVNDLKIQPCTGCMACRSTGKCYLPEVDAAAVPPMWLIRSMPWSFSCNSAASSSYHSAHSSRCAVSTMGNNCHSSSSNIAESILSACFIFTSFPP